MATNKVKNKIINTFFTLLKEKSYLDISITELAERAGVSRISFYRNFGSFDALMKEAYEMMGETTSAFINPIYAITDPADLKRYFDNMPDVLKNVRPDNITLISNVMQMSLIFKERGFLTELNEVEARERYVKNAQYYVLLSIFTEWFRSGKTEEEKEVVANVMIDLLQKINELL